MIYTNKQESLGLGKLERKRLSQLLQATKVTISVADAANTWGMAHSQAAKVLSWYTKKGWLKRIAQGVYIAVPLDSKVEEVVPEEPFVIAEKLFSPCYIGGISAVNYWDLTEQMFNTVTVMTKNKVNNRSQSIAGIKYHIHTIKPENFFGLKSVWFNNVKVKISDPTRTLVDLFMYPQFNGGIQFIDDAFKNYLTSQYKDIDLLIRYTDKLNNGAVFKRLGFIAEKSSPNEKALIEFCAANLTKGYARLSNSIDCPRIVTRWRLRVPENWKE